MSKMSTDPARHALNGPTMGTRWSVLFFAERGLDPAPLQAALQAAVDAVDAQMSLWKPGSDLMRLNAAPVGDWQQVIALLSVLSKYRGAGFGSGCGAHPAMAAVSAANTSKSMRMSVRVSRKREHARIQAIHVQRCAAGHREPLAGARRTGLELDGAANHGRVRRSHVRYSRGGHGASIASDGWREVPRRTDIHSKDVGAAR